MALIVLMEDDAATRTLVTSVLRKDGHEVRPAENGRQGLRLVGEQLPDLVISDVEMPEMNGFEMLAALRAMPTLSAVPVILLTSLQERAHMRIGMTAGADDYITKPFRPGELRDAVAAQLNRRKVQADLHAHAIDDAVRQALLEQRHELARLYEDRLTHELSERWPTGEGGGGDERFASATVLFVDIECYAEVAQKLSPAELTELVKRIYGAANDTAHLFGAHHMQFIGEGMLAVFTDDNATRTVNHGLRAARTALGMIESGRALRHYLETNYTGRQLPPLAINVALNTGPVTLTLLQDPLHGGVHKLPVGEVVSSTMLLQKQAQVLGWPVAMSVATLRMVTGGVRTRRRAMLALAGREELLDVAELVGLDLPAAAR